MGRSWRCDYWISYVHYSQCDWVDTRLVIRFALIRGLAVGAIRRYPLKGRGSQGGPLGSNELHQPLCLRRAMPQPIEPIPTMTNPMINITSESGNHNIPAVQVPTIAATPKIIRIKPTIFRTGFGTRPTTKSLILRLISHFSSRSISLFSPRSMNWRNVPAIALP